jgi:hypothetical protein
MNRAPATPYGHVLRNVIFIIDAFHLNSVHPSRRTDYCRPGRAPPAGGRWGPARWSAAGQGAGRREASAQGGRLLALLRSIIFISKGRQAAGGGAASLVESMCFAARRRLAAAAGMRAGARQGRALAGGTLPRLAGPGPVAASPERRRLARPRQRGQQAAWRREPEERCIRKHPVRVILLKVEVRRWVWMPLCLSPK